MHPACSLGLCWHFNIGESSLNHFKDVFLSYANKASLFPVLFYLTHLYKKNFNAVHMMQVFFLSENTSAEALSWSCNGAVNLLV